MLLFPKKTKFKNLYNRKKMRFLNKPIFKSSIKTFTIVSLEAAKINNKQIESLSKTLKRLLKSNGKYWIKWFPNKTTTKKPEGSRMGKGKGSPKFWHLSTFKGTVIAEMNGCCSWNKIKKIIQCVKNKLSVKVFLTFNNA
nr:ribosomal protein L16 [Phaeocystis rex]